MRHALHQRLELRAPRVRPADDAGGEDVGGGALVLEGVDGGDDVGAVVHPVQRHGQEGGVSIQHLPAARHLQDGRLVKERVDSER